MSNKNVKSFVIRVTDDGRRVEFHLPDSVITPVMPLVIGTTRFDVRSNIHAVRDHIKQMMMKEGYNRVVCMDSDFVMYRELIADLEYVDGLEVKRM